MRRPLKNGFTLVELLVVISIIAVLISILLPALGRARSYSMRAVCQSNLHQMGVALINYATENKGAYPLHNSKASQTIHVAVLNSALTPDNARRSMDKYI